MSIRGAASAPLAARGARMSGVVDAREMLEIEVCIDLRGCKIGVTEHFLHRAQIAARFEQMTGK